MGVAHQGKFEITPSFYSWCYCFLHVDSFNYCFIETGWEFCWVGFSASITTSWIAKPGDGLHFIGSNN